MKIKDINYNVLLCVLALIIIILLGIQIYQNSRQIGLLSIIASGPTASKSGRNEDQYAGGVKNQILKAYPQINNLYKAYLAKEPSVKEGTILVDFTIDTDGRVLNPQVVKSDIPDAELQSGIRKILSKIEFPEPVTERYMTHSFRFKEEKK